MYVCMYVRTYVCICVCMYVCVCICVCVYLYIYVYMYVVCVCVCVCVCMCVYLMNRYIDVGHVDTKKHAIGSPTRIDLGYKALISMAPS